MASTSLVLKPIKSKALISDPLCSIKVKVFKDYLNNQWENCLSVIEVKNQFNLNNNFHLCK